MGRRDLRWLLVVGAMTIIQRATRRPETANPWLVQMLARKPKMIVAVALANRTGPSMTLAADAPTTDGRESPATDISRIVHPQDRKTFKSSTLDPDRLREFEHRARTVQPVAGAEAREPKPSPDRSAVRIRA